MHKKIFTVVGARPQFIKAAVVSRAIAETEGITEVLVHTGQHYDSNMSDVFFDELEIPRPHHHLGVGGGTHGQNTGRMLEKLEALMQAEKPDWVLVYGDTDSTLAGALAASKLHIPVAHVEAGLRSFNRRMPEEINRVLTDHVSTILFAPTSTAVNHLVNEGIEGNMVQLVGDVMYDAALYYLKDAKPIKEIQSKLLELKEKKFVLCTIHRAENTDNKEIMSRIIDGLRCSSRIIILPIHPRTKQRLNQMGLKFPDNVLQIDPVGYHQMTWLEVNSEIIVTDSGGIQKEAYFHKKPCITIRDETEWVELVEAGFNILAGSSVDKINQALNADYSSMKFTNTLYGDGKAGYKIVKRLIEQ